MVAVAKGAGEKHASPKRSIRGDLSKRPPASLRSRGGGQMRGCCVRHTVHALSEGHKCFCTSPAPVFNYQTTSFIRSNERSRKLNEKSYRATECFIFQILKYLFIYQLNMQRNYFACFCFSQYKYQ